MDAHATICSTYPYTLMNGQTANADQVMADFNCALLTSGGTAASPNFTGTATGSNVIPPSLLTHQNPNTVLMNATGTSASPTAVPLANWVQNYKTGLILSTAGSSGTFGISAGEASDTTNAWLMALSSAYTKTTGAWAAGSGNGCFESGTSVGNNTWYTEYEIERVDTGGTDILCSASATSPTLPTNYTVFRRIGSMLTDGSAHWTLFSQLGNRFLWGTQVNDANNLTPGGTTAITQTVTVPTGAKVIALFDFFLPYVSSNTQVYISSFDQTDIAASGTVFSLRNDNNNDGPIAPYQIRTNTSAQVRLRFSGTGSNYYINTNGWIDPFGGN